jgi:hypothetical protein
MTLQELRKNRLYEEADVPAFMRIAESESWLRAIFWYTIFIACAVVCVFSVMTQYNEFMDNPTSTDVTIIRSTELQLPNISLCLSGWPSLPQIKVWSQSLM